MADKRLAPPPTAAAAPGAVAALKPVTRQKEPEQEPDYRDQAIKEYIAAYAIELQSMLVVDTDRDSAGGYDDEDRKLAEWMAATADARSARINKLMAMLGISPPRNLPEPYDQERLDELDSSVFRPEGYQKESKRRLGRDGLVRYYD
jgi:hypothetical protein